MKETPNQGVPVDDPPQHPSHLTARIVPGFSAELVSIRASSNGNYYAATLSATFQNIEQFYALDAALKVHPLVRMVL